MVLVAIKIDDDILITWTDMALKIFIMKFISKYKLGEAVHVPGSLRIFGMNIIQSEDYSVSIHADDKMKSLRPYPLSRTRRRQTEEKMNYVEKKSFMSPNASTGWRAITSVSYTHLTLPTIYSV